MCLSGASPPYLSCETAPNLRIFPIKPPLAVMAGGQGSGVRIQGSGRSLSSCWLAPDPWPPTPASNKSGLRPAEDRRRPAANFDWRAEQLALISVVVTAVA